MHLGLIRIAAFVAALFIASLAWAQPTSLDAACAALQAEHDAAMAASPADDPANYLSSASTLFACVGQGSVRWAQTLTALVPSTVVDPDGTPPPVFTERRVYRITDAGRVLAVTSPIEANYFDRPMWSLNAADYDGDGQDELVEVYYNHGAESCGDPVLRVFTWTADALVPYAPAAAISASGAQDVNGDGRLDLLMANSFTARDMGLCGDSHSAFLMPAVAQADGTFATSGDAVQQWVMAQCPAPPTFEGLLNTGDEALLAVTCARFWGVTTEAIAAELTALEAREDEMGMYDIPELLLAAQVAPPFVLTAP